MKCNTGIYKITNKINGKFYIGSTHRSFNKRWAEHIDDYKRGKRGCRLLYIAFNKHGIENFSFEILIATNLKEYILKLEQHYLDTLKPAYNFCKSVTRSILGQSLSPEWRENISKASIGKRSSKESKLKMSISQTGKKRSKESIEKGIKSHLGRRNTLETIQKMRASALKRSPPSKECIELARIKNTGTTWKMSKESIAKRQLSRWGKNDRSK